MKNNKGFTLIELLVVVLIIGILAAIALPQYFKAVRKARASEALVVVKNVKDAMDRYALAHGSFSGVSTGTLDIDVPTSTNYSYNVTNAGVTATPQDSNSGGVTIAFQTEGETATTWTSQVPLCVNGNDNAGICESLGGAVSPVSSL